MSGRITINDQILEATTSRKILESKRVNLKSRGREKSAFKKKTNDATSLNSWSAERNGTWEDICLPQTALEVEKAQTAERGSEEKTHTLFLGGAIRKHELGKFKKGRTMRTMAQPNQGD